jgi:integrase
MLVTTERIIQTQNTPIEFKSYLARYSEVGQGVAKSIVSEFARFLEVNNAKLSSVTQDLLDIYLLDLRRSDIKNGTYNTKVSYLKAFLGHMGMQFEYKYQKVEAYQNTKLVSYDGFNRVISFLDDKRQIEGKKQAKHLRDYIIFSLLFVTGMRKNEIISMRHEDITIEAGKYFFTANAKGSKEITKEIPIQLFEAIETLKAMEGKEGHHHIFTSTRSNNAGEFKKLSHDSLNYVINQYYQKINNTKEVVTIHSIRNQSGYQYYQATGNDILSVQDHLGHANISTTEKYLRQVHKKKSDASSVLYGMLQG